MVDNLFKIGDIVIETSNRNNTNIVYGTVVDITKGKGIYWVKWDFPIRGQRTPKVLPINWMLIESATSYLRDKKLNELL